MTYERPDFYMGKKALQEASKTPTQFHKSALVDSLFPKKREMTFRKSWLKLGIRKHFKDDDYSPNGNAMMLDLRSVVRMLVLGSAGSGKTNLMKRMGEFAHFGGMPCAYITDIKDEMKYSSRPTPPHLAKWLDEDELPTALPV